MLWLSLKCVAVKSAQTPTLKNTHIIWTAFAIKAANDVDSCIRNAITTYHSLGNKCNSNNISPKIKCYNQNSCVKESSFMISKHLPKDACGVFLENRNQEQSQMNNYFKKRSEINIKILLGRTNYKWLEERSSPTEQRTLL